MGSMGKSPPMMIKSKKITKLPHIKREKEHLCPGCAENTFQNRLSKGIPKGADKKRSPNKETKTCRFHTNIIDITLGGNRNSTLTLLGNIYKVDFGKTYISNT